MACEQAQPTSEVLRDRELARAFGPRINGTGRVGRNGQLAMLLHFVFVIFVC